MEKESNTNNTLALDEIDNEITIISTTTIKEPTMNEKMEPPTSSESDDDDDSAASPMDPEQRQQRDPASSSRKRRQEQQKYADGQVDCFVCCNDNTFLQYFWYTLAFITIGFQIAAIALDPKSPIVYVMGIISIYMCIKVISRRTKLKHWDATLNSYQTLRSTDYKNAMKTNKRYVARIDNLDRKELRLLRKEKKLKKLLKKNGELGQNMKKVHRLTNRHRKQVEKQRQFIYEELRYQALSAVLSIQPKDDDSAKDSSLSSKNNNKTKNDNTVGGDNGQQMEYFTEMLQDIPQLDFHTTVFTTTAITQKESPLQFIIKFDSMVINLLTNTTKNNNNGDESSSWYPHSNTIYTRLLQSPYSSFASSKRRIILTKQEESKASRFRKMLKLGVPKEAARTKMQIEKASPRIIASVLGEELPEDEEDDDDDGKKSNKNKKKTKEVFHWEPLKFDENENENDQDDTEDYLQDEEKVNKPSLENSIWSKASNQQSSRKKKDDKVISKHIKSYTKKRKNAQEDGGGDDDEAAIAKAMASSNKKKDKAGIVDLNRARNIDITLKSFNDISHQDLATIIALIDPTERLKGDRLLLLSQLVPTPQEVQAIAQYIKEDGPDYRLVTAEKWFSQVVNIQRIEDKATAIKTIGTFDDIVAFMETNFTVLTNACTQVMTSDKLQDLVAMILRIGNRMNNGKNGHDDDEEDDGNTSVDSKDKVAGFNVEFLTQMSYTKGTDKTTTALDLLVTIFVDQGRRETLMLKDDIHDCSVGSDIQISTLIGDFSLLEAAVKQCQCELDALKKDQKAAPKPFGKSGGGVKKFGGGGGGRFNLNQELLAKGLGKIHATQNGGDSEAPPAKPSGGGVFDMHKELLAKKLGKINAGKPGSPADSSKKGAAAGVGKSGGSGNSTTNHHNLDATIRRLENFLEMAKKQLAALAKKRDQATESCKRLAEFFCESSGENSANTLLTIIDEFSSNLDQALKRHDEKMGNEAKLKERRDRAKKKMKLAMANLNNNLQVISMLKQLRTDAEVGGWDHVRKAMGSKKKTSNGKAKKGGKKADGGWGGLLGDVVAKSKANKQKAQVRVSESFIPSKKRSSKETFFRRSSLRKSLRKPDP